MKNEKWRIKNEKLWWGRKAIPPSWRQKSLQYKKSGHIASRKQQSNSLYFAVNPPPFDKGGKCDSAFRGIVRKRRSRWGDVGAVKTLLLYYRTPFWRVLRIEYKEFAVYSNGGFLCLGRVWYGARDGSTAIPPVVARIFSGDSTSPLTREARVLAISYILWNRQSVHKEESLVFAVYVWLWWIVKIFVGEWACVKSNMVYTLCKHMVYMLSITNEHKNELEMRAKPEWKVHFLCFASAKRGSFSIR